MKFKDGAGVFTMENEQVGHLIQVVLEPKTMKVSHMVVRKGFLLTKDKVVPLDVVDHVDEDKIFLKKNIEDLADFPELEETQYIQAQELEKLEKGSSKSARPVYWYPAIGIPGYGHHTVVPPTPLYYAVTQRNIPEDAVALKGGAKIICTDGEHVGNIDEVLVDPEDERATHIVIEEGHLFQGRKLIPTIWLTNVIEEEAHLVMESSALEKVAEYKA